MVTPTAAHLVELVGALGLLTVDGHKQERLDRQLDPYLSAESARAVEQTMLLPHRDIEALVEMGPSAHHLDPATARELIAALPDPMPVTCSVTVERPPPTDGAGPEPRPPWIRVDKRRH